MLFEFDRDLPKEQGGQYLPSFFHDFKAFPHRDSAFNNEIKQRTTKNGKTIQSWMMYKFVDINLTPDGIKEEMKKIGMMADDEEIQDRYYHLIKGQGFTGELVDQTKKGSGNYYAKLKGAALHNVKTVAHNCLIDIFREDEIKEIIRKMFNENKPLHLWPDEVRFFAVNNVT